MKDTILPPFLLGRRMVSTSISTCSGWWLAFLSGRSWFDCWSLLLLLLLVCSLVRTLKCFVRIRHDWSRSESSWKVWQRRLNAKLRKHSDRGSTNRRWHLTHLFLAFIQIYLQPVFLPSLLNSSQQGKKLERFCCSPPRQLLTRWLKPKLQMFKLIWISVTSHWQLLVPVNMKIRIFWKWTPNIVSRKQTKTVCCLVSTFCLQLGKSFVDVLLRTRNFVLDKTATTWHVVLNIFHIYSNVFDLNIIIAAVESRSALILVVLILISVRTTFCSNCHLHCLVV